MKQWKRVLILTDIVVVCSIRSPHFKAEAGKLVSPADTDDDDDEMMRTRLMTKQVIALNDRCHFQMGLSTRICLFVVNKFLLELVWLMMLRVLVYHLLKAVCWGIGMRPFLYIGHIISKLNEYKMLQNLPLFFGKSKFPGYAIHVGHRSAAYTIQVSIVCLR